MTQDYKTRVTEQIKQFKDPSKLKKLPPIYQYYMAKFIRPKLAELFDVNNALEVYLKSILEALSMSQSNKIMSIGSGDGQLEIKLAEQLIAQGNRDFTLECHEISPLRLERSKKLADEKGLLGNFSFHNTDLNDFQLNHKYAVFIAHHTLHHIVELEALFSTITDFMDPNGKFITFDMIGRNGHMRWPEALEFIEKMWPFIPEHYKFQHQFQRFHKEFVNWDCSSKGFEGIRSQDILRLISENFDYDRFFAYGNLPDMFIERGYGHNLDVNNEKDTAFIDFLEHLNETLIDCGYLKPTIMVGAFTRKDKISQRIVYKNRTPEFCIRNVT